MFVGLVSRKITKKLNKIDKWISIWWFQPHVFRTNTFIPMTRFKTESLRKRNLKDFWYWECQNIEHDEGDKMIIIDTNNTDTF